MADALDTLCDWIAIPSVTGEEGDYGDAVSRELEAAGLDVERQRVEGARSNVLARAGDPAVVFCTHLDTVPPWFGPSREGGVVRGRGACDAKGPALAMIEAARRLLADGEDRIGFLLTVGEETDGAGARHANEHLADPWRPRSTIVGEPTDNRFVRGHKGVLRCTLRARGVAGHSSQDVGPSAVHELVHALHRVLSDEWGDHPLFGRGTVNAGTIRGGLAANVVAPDAEAEVLARLVEEPERAVERMRSHAGEHVECLPGKGYGPVEFEVPEGEEGIVVAFGTDAPFLGRWGGKMLYGPGSILDAHTDHEKLEERSFERAVRDYERAARELLAREA